MDFTPTLPDVMRGLRYRVAGNTQAGANVDVDTIRPSPAMPHVLIRDDGSAGEPSDNRADRKRATFECRAKTPEEAKALCFRVRDLFRPPDEVVDGWHGNVEMPAIPVRGVPAQTVHFSGASLAAGPFRLDDEVLKVPCYQITFVITYS